MDQTNILATSVSPLTMPQLIIETNEQKRYWVDLSMFTNVECFPKSKNEWENVFITEGGYNITWGNRFEVQVLQAIDTATKIENIKIHA